MHLKRNEWAVLAANLAYVVPFGMLSIGRLNYEFVIYGLVIILVMSIIVLCQPRLEFSPPILWGLTCWGFLHMAGGHVFVGGRRIYELILVDVFPAYSILRYDHFVHCIGFGVATLVCYHLLARHLRSPDRPPAVVCGLAVLMGMGVGALNEIIELGVVLVVPESGVGDYENTAFDLVFNMLGAIIAMAVVRVRSRRTSDATHGTQQEDRT